MVVPPEWGGEALTETLSRGFLLTALLSALEVGESAGQRAVVQ
ncbi:hypothetical protein [Streptomyces sp. NPDC001500]